MKILVTGSSGFIGTNVLLDLPQSAQVEQVDLRNPQGFDICNSSDFQYFKFIPTTIIHLAAFTGVLNSIRTPVYTFKQNVIGTLNILEYMRRYKVNHLIFASSCSVLSDQPTPYSTSKLICEQLIQTYAYQYGIRADIIRLTNVYGPHSLHKTSVIPKFLKLLFTNKPLSVRGDGTQTRSFIYVKDVVDLIKSLIYSPSKFKIHTLASDQVTINHLVNTLINLHPDPIEIDLTPKESEPDRLKIEPTIEATTSLKVGLTKTYFWFKEKLA